MPTGYTDEIGKGQSFDDFFVNCSKAFMIHMRDNPYDKIDYPSKDNYYSRELVEVEERYNNFLKMSREEIQKQLDDHFNEQIEYATKKLKETIELKYKLLVMKKHAESWKPPSEKHVKFKNFMIEQIDITIKGDCSTNYYDNILKSKKGTVEQYIHQQKEAYERDRRYYTEHSIKAIERENAGIDWMKKLFLSVDLENYEERFKGRLLCDYKKKIRENKIKRILN